MPRKPRILFILHLPPPVHGASMVGKYIHDSELVNSEFECHYVNLTTADSLEDIGKFCIRKITSFVRLIRRVRESVRNVRPDLVYITPNAKGLAFFKDFMTMELLKRMRCKVVAHYHNKGVSTKQDGMLYNLLYRRFFKGIKVILLAETLYQDIKKYVDKDNVFFCPNGIPNLLGDTQKDMSLSVPHILFLSNLIISKGVLVLLDALTLLKSKGCQFVCDYVGGETADMDAQKFKDEIEKRCLQDSVVYHGRKYGNEKEAFWTNAAIFAFPTYYHNECFPIVLLEAMQHGLPCVSTNEGGIPGIVEDGKTGYVIGKGDVQGLADTLQRLLADEHLREKMGAAAKRKFEREFTIGTFERRFCEVLKAIVSVNESKHP